MAGAQSHLIVYVTVAFFTSLLVVVGCISLLRQRRLRQRHTLADIFAPFSEETRPMTALEESQQLLPLIIPSKRTPHRASLPEKLRLRPQPANPELVVLSIEPPDGPTRDQRNVQKLIAFLKRETTDAERIKKVG